MARYTEVDPRNVSEEKITTYAKNGINRVSIGVQDFNLEVQNPKNCNKKATFRLASITLQKKTTACLLPLKRKAANSLIGFGASAISYLPFGYSQNTLDFDEYKKNILGENLAVKKGVKISEDDRMHKKIIDELMCYLEVDLKKVCEEFNLEKNYFEKDGLLRVKNNSIKINLAAPQISLVVSSVF